MGNLIDDSPEAEAWLDAAIAGHSDKGVFSHISGSVVWSDSRGEGENVILPFDPTEIVAGINERPLPLQRDHDPGRPIGKVLEAAQFKTLDGRAFVAAVLGFYDPTVLKGFRALGIDIAETAATPDSLPPLPADFRIIVEADPKEVSVSATADLVSDLGVPVEVGRRSHNSAEAAQQLVAIGVTFTVLVWNPLVKTFAEEAGKDVYKLARTALKTLLERTGVLDNPLVEIQSHQSGCAVSFIIRGKGTDRHRKANASLSDAALRSRRLIDNLLAAGLEPSRLVYEFGHDDEVWVPSFAELADGRLVSDNLSLIAVENLPTGLSLGLTVQEAALED